MLFLLSLWEAALLVQRPNPSGTPPRPSWLPGTRTGPRLAGVTSRCAAWDMRVTAATTPDLAMGTVLGLGPCSALH